MTSRNPRVSPASVTVSASSFWVFWRTAPSTSAIIRSRKDSPAPAVIFTLIWSESTRVPPVTPERSPPASRTTGADSPVIADSSMLAAPSITSPSLGMVSPALTSTISPDLSRLELTGSSFPEALRRLAVVWVRVFFRLSACALPRASASASAKFAKRTVSHSTAVTRVV